MHLKKTFSPTALSHLQALEQIKVLFWTVLWYLLQECEPYSFPHSWPHLDPLCIMHSLHCRGKVSAWLNFNKTRPKVKRETNQTEPLDLNALVQKWTKTLSLKAASMLVSAIAVILKQKNFFFPWPQSALISSSIKWNANYWLSVWWYCTLRWCESSEEFAILGR